jgi:hypothetical protein
MEISKKRVAKFDDPISQMVYLYKLNNPELGPTDPEDDEFLAAAARLELEEIAAYNRRREEYYKRLIS